MKKTIKEYVLTEMLYENSNSLVYRAVQKQGNTSVILKVLQPDNRTPDDLNHLKHEYGISHSFIIEGINKVFSMESYHNTLAFIEEVTAADSMDQYMKRHMLDLDECLSIVMQTAQNIGHIHAENVIHKNIRPSNVIWNTKTGQLEGTIAYLSPGLTGQINCSSNSRTDLYSFRVTLCKMFTGQ
jgi:serine/threonine protein kinase